MTTERGDLTARTIPVMTLGDGAPGSLSGPPAPLAASTAAARAAERFGIKGNAIVTGGAGGLGFAVGTALLEHGASGLMIFDMNPDEAGPKVESLRAQFPSARVEFQRVDVTDEDGVEASVRETVRLLGSVDVVLNFAGMVSNAPATDFSSKTWGRVLGVNTVGGYLVAAAAARTMIEAGRGGSIVFVASISGHQVNYPQPQTVYNVSKAGVISLAKSLAAEWAVHGIRVNSISPGYMDTILNDGDGLEELRKSWASRCPMGRMGQPDELAGAVVMLASRAGSYITGADLLIDGGQTLLL